MERAMAAAQVYLLVWSLMTLMLTKPVMSSFLERNWDMMATKLGRQLFKVPQTV